LAAIEDIKRATEQDSISISQRNTTLTVIEPKSASAPSTMTSLQASIEWKDRLDGWKKLGLYLAVVWVHEYQLQNYLGLQTE
jgi:hypothetical protein